MTEETPVENFPSQAEAEQSLRLRGFEERTNTFGQKFWASDEWSAYILPVGYSSMQLPPSPDCPVNVTFHDPSDYLQAILDGDMEEDEVYQEMVVTGEASAPEENVPLPSPGFWGRRE